MNIFGCIFLLLDVNSVILKAAEEALLIPFGTGIVGHVAKTKTGLRIDDAYLVSSGFFYGNESFPLAYSFVSFAKRYFKLP